MSLLAESCLASNDWVCWEYVESRQDDILAALGEHVTLTGVSVGIGLLVAVPLALVARRFARAEGPVLGLAAGLYTVPSLAMFSLLLPLTGLQASTVIIGLVLYSLTILVRSVLAGLQGVPPDVIEAARGMGYGPVRVLLTIEFPLAVPATIAGLRVATVSTVALTTVGAIVGYGGLGNLIYEALPSLFKAQVLTASVLCVALAIVADLLLLGAQRVLTPWQRGA